MIGGTLQQWYASLPRQPERIWVAYSGGRDSHCLLHALRSQFPLSQLIACHVNHNLNVKSADWVQHCQKTAAQLNVPIYTHTLSSQPEKGQSIEAWARTARYTWFKTLLGPNDVLCTAHTQNDQAETLLLNLMRGSGLNGLSGIAAMKPFGVGQLARPLLGVNRQAINTYCDLYHLRHVEDDSNLDQKFERNYLRHSLLPLMGQRYPSVISTLARTAQHCSETVGLLDELAKLDLGAVLLPGGQYIQAAELSQLSYERQKNVLRYWLRLHHFPLPSEVKLDDILRQVGRAAIDRHPQIKWGNVQLRRIKGEIVVDWHTGNLTSVK